MVDGLIDEHAETWEALEQGWPTRGSPAWFHAALTFISKIVFVF